VGEMPHPGDDDDVMGGNDLYNSDKSCANLEKQLHCAIRRRSNIAAHCIALRD
jgi:hypothetical protein